ncbi:hypothetical protein GCM10009739_20850 [Microbacterium ulmi]
MSDRFWPDAKASIVLIPSGEQGESILALAAQWTKMGLLGPALWVQPERVAQTSSGPPRIVAVVLGLGADLEIARIEVDLFEALAREALTVVRLVKLRSAAPSRELDEQQDLIAERVREYVRKSMPMPNPGAPIVDQAAELKYATLICAPTEFQLKQRVDWAGSEYGVVVIASPEDRSSPWSGDAFVRDDERFVGFTLLHLASVAGLWSGVPTGSFELVRREESGHRSVWLSRVFVNAVLTESLGRRTAAYVLAEAARPDSLLVDPSLSAPPPGTAFIDDADVSGYIDEMVRGALSLDDGALTFRKPVQDEEPLKRRVGFWRQLGRFLSFSVDKIARMPMWTWRAITSRTYRQTTRLLHSDEGADLVGNAYQEAFDVREQALIADAERIADDERRARAEASAPAGHAHVRTTPALWARLRELVFGSLDGSADLSGLGFAPVEDVVPIFGRVSDVLALPDDPWVAPRELVPADFPERVDWYVLALEDPRERLVAAAEHGLDRRLDAERSLSDATAELAHAERSVPEPPFPAAPNAGAGPAARPDPAPSAGSADPGTAQRRDLAPSADVTDPTSAHAPDPAPSAGSADPLPDAASVARPATSSESAAANRDVASAPSAAASSAAAPGPATAPAAAPGPATAPVPAGDRAAMGDGPHPAQTAPAAARAESALHRAVTASARMRVDAAREELEAAADDANRLADGVRAFDAWAVTQDRSFVWRLLTRLAHERREAEQHSAQLSDQIEHMVVPRPGELITLRRRFHRTILVTWLIGLIAGALIVLGFVAVGGAAQRDPDFAPDGAYRFLSWMAAIVVAIVVVVTIGALVSYHVGWSRFQRRIDVQRVRLSQLGRNARQARQEAVRLGSLHRQTVDWLVLLSRAIHRPWNVPDQWRARDEYTVARGAMPFALQIATIQDDDHAAAARLRGVMTEHLVVKGWRHAAFEALVTEVAIERGALSSAFGLHTLDEDLPHASNHTRRMLLAALDDEGILTRVAGPRLEALVKAAQRDDTHGARPRVRPVMDNPLHAITRGADRLSDWQDVPWDEFLLGSLAGRRDPITPLSATVLTDVELRERHHERVQSHLVLPTRLASTLRYAEDTPVQIVPFADHGSATVDLSWRVDIAGPVPIKAIHLWDDSQLARTQAADPPPRRDPHTDSGV